MEYQYIGQYITETEVESFLGRPFERYHTFFEDSKKLALEKNNEVLYLQYVAEQNRQNLDDSFVQ